MVGVLVPVVEEEDGGVVVEEGAAAAWEERLWSGMRRLGVVEVEDEEEDVNEDGFAPTDLGRRVECGLGRVIPLDCGRDSDPPTLGPSFGDGDRPFGGLLSLEDCWFTPSSTRNSDTFSVSDSRHCGQGKFSREEALGVGVDVDVDVGVEVGVELRGSGFEEGCVCGGLDFVACDEG